MRGSRRADRRHKGLENFVGGKQYFEIHLGVHYEPMKPMGVMCSEGETLKMI